MTMLRTLPLLLMSAFVAISGVGCAPQTTADIKGDPAFRSIAVVAFLTDEVRGEWSDGAERKSYGPTSVAWNTRSVTADIVRSILEGTDTQVITVTNPEQYLKPGDAQVGQDAWPSLVVGRLREAGRIQTAEAVLLLRQKAIDATGREYSPARNFWWGGFIGLIAGEMTKEAQYFPSYLVAINSGMQEAMIGQSRCLIGFDAHLFVTAKQAVTARSYGLVGSHIVPRTHWSRSYEEYPDALKRDLQTRCHFALRKALAESMVRTGLAHRP